MVHFLGIMYDNDWVGIVTSKKEKMEFDWKFEHA